MRLQEYCDPEEIKLASARMIKRFPQIADWAQSMPAAEVAFVITAPQAISLLDYEKGFGYTELVTV